MLFSLFNMRTGSGGEREKPKSIDLTDMASVFLQPMQSLLLKLDGPRSPDLTGRSNGQLLFRRKLSDYNFETF